MDSGKHIEDDGERPSEPAPSAPEERDLYAAPNSARMDALLASYAASRDPAARRTLILYHQKLVRHVAGRFLHRGEPIEDLVQVGMIGLINALDRFDPASGVKFSTFAMPTIVGEIKRHFRDKTWHVKVPRWLQEISARARLAEETLSVRNGRAATVAEISAEIQATEEQTLEALALVQVAWALSLDAPALMESGSDSATLGDVVGKLDQALRDIETYADVQRALEKLDVRERRVIHLRFFEDLSQRQIAIRTGLSQMQVSRLEKRALIRLHGLLSSPAH